MPWWYAVAERDHDIQNPTSPEKIRLLGERLRLTARSQVLDVACGKGAPAVLLASTFGCRITGVERAAEFAAAARARVAAAGLDDRIEIVEQDAKELDLEAERYDVAMCLGASFIWDGLARTLSALAPAAKSGGHVIVGEPYWRRWPLPGGIDHGGYVPLGETAERFAAAGLRLHTLIDASQDDWDRYETLHWRAVEEWLDENPDDPDAPEFRRRHERYRDEYLAWQRELLGWAIFAARRS
jgi:SAM-dependent methyltransferase